MPNCPNNKLDVRNKNIINDIEKNKQKKVKQLLEKALFNSCDPKVLSLLNSIKNQEERKINLIRDEFIKKDNSMKSNWETEKKISEFKKKVEKRRSRL